MTNDQLIVPWITANGRCQTGQCWIFVFIKSSLCSYQGVSLSLKEFDYNHKNVAILYCASWEALAARKESIYLSLPHSPVT